MGGPLLVSRADEAPPPLGGPQSGPGLQQEQACRRHRALRARPDRGAARRAAAAQRLHRRWRPARHAPILIPRKTGLPVALAVVGCTRNPSGCYTLYPPGHLPYGRRVVPCSPSAPAAGRRHQTAHVWQATLFAAASMRPTGWPSHSPADDDRHRRTQRRRWRWPAGSWPPSGARPSPAAGSTCGPWGRDRPCRRRPPSAA